MNPRTTVFRTEEAPQTSLSGRPSPIVIGPLEAIGRTTPDEASGASLNILAGALPEDSD